MLPGSHSRRTGAPRTRNSSHFGSDASEDNNSRIDAAEQYRYLSGSWRCDRIHHGQAFGSKSGHRLTVAAKVSAQCSMFPLYLTWSKTLLEMLLKSSWWMAVVD